MSPLTSSLIALGGSDPVECLRRRGAVMDGVDDFLKTVSLFQDLDKRHRATIAKTVFERTFEPGEAIVREGETGVGVFMIRKGKVEVTKESGDETEHLNTLGP